MDDSTVQEPNARRTAAVVLGSGGARGYAHIGALEVIEEAGIEVVAVSGCSMGALVGGVYAAGQLAEYRDWVLTLRRSDVVRMLDLSLSSMGAIRGDKLFATMREMIGDTRIEDLAIPYTAVATDLRTQREVWFQAGSLADAIRASIAIPSLLAPVITGNQFLVDGALLNPVPILPTLSAHADITIAVSVTGKMPGHSPTKPSGPLIATDDVDTLDDEIPDGGDGPVAHTGDAGGAGADAADAAATALAAGESSFPDALRVRAEALRESASRLLDWEAVRSMLQRESDADSGEADVATDDDDTIAEFGRLDIMNMAYDTMQSALTSYKLAGYPPDIMVEIPKSSARTFEFYRAAELIELGRTQTEDALEEFDR